MLRSANNGAGPSARRIGENNRRMLKYIIRKVLYMIPTIFGVILITFLLFNVAGGDPSVQALGKNATPQSLEENDIERGYNKPTFVGNWSTTRAYSHESFKDNAGPWNRVEGIVYTNRPSGRLALAGGKSYKVPLALNLRTNDSYRCVVECKATGADAAFEIVDNSNVVQTVKLASGSKFRKASIDFKTGGNTENLQLVFKPGEGGVVEVKSLTLRRANKGLWDSQLVFYLWQIARFDFGTSLATNQKVSRMILDGILPSLALTVPIFLISLLVQIPLALLCAFFRNRFIDRFIVILAVTLMSVNYLVWIVFGQYFLGYDQRWFPVWGFESVRYLFLPWIIGVASGLGSGVRFYRTLMLDEMYRDYVRTAFAKGVSRSGVLFKHVLKNAMIPIITNVVMTIPFLYTGSLLLESFFGIPGLGNLAINGINNSDADVVRAVVLVGTFLFVIANLITDICYTLVDPRVRIK